MHPGSRNDQLSTLDRAAVLAYQESMARTIEDPGRLKAAYSAKFAAEPVRERVRLICETARAALSADGCEANLVLGPDEQFNVVSELTHVGQSFCRYVVSEGSVFNVESAATHALVCESVAVTDQGLRSYLGLPLLWDDEAVGAFCVFDHEPRRWRPFEVQVLAGFATAVVDTMSWDDEHPPAPSL